MSDLPVLPLADCRLAVTHSLQKIRELKGTGHFIPKSLLADIGAHLENYALVMKASAPRPRPVLPVRDGHGCRGPDVEEPALDSGWVTLNLRGHGAEADPSADSGELPRPGRVPPMTGRWEMIEHEATERGKLPEGLEPDALVIVAAEPDGPYHLERAGDVSWGPLGHMTIRWWRRASMEEVLVGRALQQSRVTTFSGAACHGEPDVITGLRALADRLEAASRADPGAVRRGSFVTRDALDAATL